jgi:O-antigen/teichoic acid export membrane protein
LKTIGNFIFNLSARILFTAISVISGFYLVRHLGPAQYGVIGIYTTLLQFIPGIICFSLFDSYGKEFAEKGLVPRLFSEAVVSISAFGAFSFLLVVTTSGLMNSLLGEQFDILIYIILGAHLFFYLVNAMHERILEAIGRPQITSSVQFLTSIITVLSVVYTIAFKQNFYPYLICQAFISFASLLTYIIYYKRSGLLKKFVFYFNPGSFMRALKYGFSIYIAGLFFMISQRIPVFITQTLYGLAFVSFLNVPLNLYGRLYLPVYSLCAVLTPKFSGGDAAANRKNFEYGLKLTLILFIPSMAFFIFGSGNLIPILYGHKFADAVIPAVLLAPFLLFYAVNIFFNSVINYLGIAETRLKYIKYAVIIDILAIAAGTFFFGFYGLISSFSISIIALTIFDFHLISRKIKLDSRPVINDIVKISLCTLPVPLFCFLASSLGSVLYLAGCCGAGIVYLLLIFLTGVVNKDEIVKLFGAFNFRLR